MVARFPRADGGGFRLVAAQYLHPTELPESVRRMLTFGFTIRLRMRGFKAVPNELNFPAKEHEVLQRWSDERTFEQSVEQRAGAPPFIFYDGPPFATGTPHYGHVLTSYIKDVVPRYFTMRGFHVPRRWGWDCHGLPIEYEVEKELGFGSKTDILRYGIDRFNESCRGMVLRYAFEWQEVIGRLGRWVDFEHAYRTMDPSYMESVVWAFKALWERGLIYEGRKVVPYCTRCQTPLSNFEARQDDATRPRSDPAVSVRFQRKDDPSQAFIAWTTTPWTLPSNVALAVGAEIDYVRFSKDGQSVWLAKSASERYAGELAGYEPAEVVRGSQLEGLHYEPLFPYFTSTPGAFRILVGEFVSTEDGTGIVHLAPAFGEEDAALCGIHGIEGPNPVQEDGTFDATVPELAGLHVFEANARVIQMLKRKNALFSHHQITHNYPHCWRCDSPLIYWAIVTWFVRVTELKSKMIAANQRIRWVPEHIGEGRFGKWLENARDWAVSRNRFWGSPVPVWRCNNCKAMAVIGSQKELEERSGQEISDWHRPAIDSVTMPCDCGGTMTRVSEVLDCWFESGAMPYGQTHYPFERKAEFEASFPGDFIVEYIAQTRGWFYTLVVLAAALFDERPFKNAICHGVILASDGRKMSKRLRNYPDPMELVETHGSDALRIALLQSPVVRGTDIRFSSNAVREAVRRFCIPLWNCVHYFTAYAAIDGFGPAGRMAALTSLDRYLLSETDRLRQTLEDLMEAYDLAGCYNAIEQYIVMLSTWYIRLTRRRLWTAGASADKSTAFEVLYAALSQITLLMAPFLPFLCESMHQALGGSRSVHLEDWPAAHPEWRDHALSAAMDDVRTIVGLARGIREAHRISHRQPLRSIAVANVPAETLHQHRDILLEELNVKDVRRLETLEGHVRAVINLDYARVGKRLRRELATVEAALKTGDYDMSEDRTLLRAGGHDLEQGDFSLRYVPLGDKTGAAAEGNIVVVVDLEIDAGLHAERIVRDVNRGVQDLRKDAKLQYADRILVGIVAPGDVQSAVVAHRSWLAAETLAVDIRFEPLPAPEAQKEIDIGEEERAEIMLQRA